MNKSFATYFLFCSLVFCLGINISISAAYTADRFDANSNSWLIGSWLLEFDPDGDPEDRILFKSDGEFVATQTSTGFTMGGSFTLNKNIIKLIFIRDGKFFSSIELTYDKNRDKLYFKSDRTGNTSYYVRVDA